VWPAAAAAPSVAAMMSLLCCCSAAQGPREDSGFSSGVDTGVRLASQLYTYCKKFHPKTQVMASGLRTKDGRQATSLMGQRKILLNAGGGGSELSSWHGVMHST